MFIGAFELFFGESLSVLVSLLGLFIFLGNESYLFYKGSMSYRITIASIVISTGVVIVPLTFVFAEVWRMYVDSFFKLLLLFCVYIPVAFILFVAVNLLLTSKLESYFNLETEKEE